MKQKTRYLYILLTRTGSVPSRVIAKMTRAEFTHVILALDESFDQAYSFARLYPHFIFPGGMVKENLWRGLYLDRHDLPCRLLRLPVTEDEHFAVTVRVQSMFARRAQYHYNYLGVAANYFGLEHHSENRRFCSEFVAEMVALGDPSANIHPASTRPVDFTSMPELECVYDGTLNELRARIEESRTRRAPVWGPLAVR